MIKYCLLLDSEERDSQSSVVYPLRCPQAAVDSFKHMVTETTLVELRRSQKEKKRKRKRKRRKKRKAKMFKGKS